MNKWSVVGFIFGLVCIGVVGYILLDVSREDGRMKVTEQPVAGARPALSPQTTNAAQQTPQPPDRNVQRPVPALQTAQQRPPAATDAAPQHTPARLFLTREVQTGRYQPGGTVDVKLSFLKEGSEPVTAMGMEETLPEGWTFEGFASQEGALPDIKRVVGNKVEFAWFNIPQYPATFSYRLRAPQDASGAQDIAGEALYRTSGNEQRTGLIVTPLEMGEAAAASAAAPVTEAQPAAMPETALTPSPAAATPGTPAESSAQEAPGEAASPESAVPEAAKAEEAAAAPVTSGITIVQGAANSSFKPGETVQVDVELGYSGAEAVTAVGLQTVLPDGWTFEAVTGGNAPTVAPQQGRAGVLEFAWIEVPQWPAKFSYTVRVPESESASREIATTALYHTSGDLVTTEQARLPLSMAAQ
ncbi:MAG: hypothetical protein KA184_12555 [Candidatus Hydrogenedentes bacterium]|nr:hypothetical protein [Candidatus Hydrogenedentota bacterium]